MRRRGIACTRAPTRNSSSSRGAICVARAALSPHAVAALHHLLTEIGSREPRLARIAECRIFAGMECHEVAEVLGVTERTVQREWLRIKALLVYALQAP